MRITDEIVAAAAEALVQHVGGKYAPSEMDDVREEVRVILEAATPMLFAQAAKEAVPYIQNFCSRRGLTMRGQEAEVLALNVIGSFA